jgi:hypothetical protein
VSVSRLMHDITIKHGTLRELSTTMRSEISCTLIMRCDVSVECSDNCSYVVTMHAFVTPAPARPSDIHSSALLFDTFDFHLSNGRL